MINLQTRFFHWLNSIIFKHINTLLFLIVFKKRTTEKNYYIFMKYKIVIVLYKINICQITAYYIPKLFLLIKNS